MNCSCTHSERRCHTTSRMYDDFTVLSLELPLEMHAIRRDVIMELVDNVLPAAQEGYRVQFDGTVRRYLIDKFFEGRSPYSLKMPSWRDEDESNQSDDLKTSGYYADGSESYDSFRLR